MPLNKSLTQQHLLKHPEKLSRFSKVYIWSAEHRAWWRSEASGYTNDIESAGIYEIDNAWGKVMHCDKSKRIIIYEATK